MMAIVVKGDAMSVEDIDRAFKSIDGVDAVISSIGGTSANPEADSVGNINLIEAAARNGVKKFILVTSIGEGGPGDGGGGGGSGDGGYGGGGARMLDCLTIALH